MSPELAQQVVAGITLLGAVVWLLALKFLVQSARLPRSQDCFEPPPAPGWLTGRVEVDGDPAALADRAAALLAKGPGAVKIVAKAEDRLVFERCAGGIANQPAGRCFRRGELRFTALGRQRTQVDWAVEPGNLRWLLWVGGTIQVAGLMALSIGSWALVTRVAASPEPAVRWQSLQMLQVVHFLWPPFLFASLYRNGVRAVAAEFETLANNLPYLG